MVLQKQRQFFVKKQTKIQFYIYIIKRREKQLLVHTYKKSSRRYVLFNWHAFLLQTHHYTFQNFHYSFSYNNNTTRRKGSFCKFVWAYNTFGRVPHQDPHIHTKLTVYIFFRMNDKLNFLRDFRAHLRILYIVPVKPQRVKFKYIYNRCSFEKRCTRRIEILVRIVIFFFFFF